jgi:hypothetical protein
MVRQIGISLVPFSLTNRSEKKRASDDALATGMESHIYVDNSNLTKILLLFVKTNLNTRIKTTC